MIVVSFFDIDDLGVLPEARIQTGVETPIRANYRLVPVSVRNIPRWRRKSAIKAYIDEADLIVMGTGTYTFMRSWAHFAMVYGFTKNRPMMAISDANMNSGWSREITGGPNPFTRIRWNIDKGEIRLYALDAVFEVVWRFKTAVPKQSVHYRLKGTEGTLEQIAPMYDYVLDDASANFPAWMKRAIWLAGL
ncbi:hypothetical protein JZ785_07195 [Alicyclobacillus curvatus]|nr:hypothetical protein JZ785_07195 [Alicyclobacillus curvatus]